MKINRISLTAFRSHTKTLLENLASVNLFVGPNGVGKSSILDAIGFALTGVCRGLDEGGRGAEGLACQLENAPKASPSVELGTDRGVILRAVGQGPRSKAHAGIVGKLGLDERVVRVLAAPTNLLLLPRNKQEEVFLTLTGGGVKPEIVAATLTTLGIDAGLYAADELLTPAGREQKLSYLRQRRVDLKREISGLVFVPSDKPLPKADETKRRQMETQLSDLNKSITLGRNGDELAKKNRTHYDELLKLQYERLNDLSKRTLAGDIMTEEQVRHCRAEIERRGGILAALNSAEKDLRSALSEQERISDYATKIKSLGDCCSECRQKVSKEHIERQLEELRSKYRAITDSLPAKKEKTNQLAKEASLIDERAILDRVAKAERAKHDVQASIDERQRIESAITEIKGKQSAIVDPEIKDWSALENKAEELRRNIENLREAALEMEAANTVNRKRSVLEQQLEGMEKLIEALNPGGAIPQLLAADGTRELLAIVQEAAQKLNLGPVDIAFDPWQIKLDGRPIELASASEQYRVAAAFGVAFARRAGADILCLDGGEILRGYNRDAFQEFLFSCGVKQVFVAVTVDDVPENLAPTEDFAMFAVDKNALGASLVKFIPQGVAA